MIASGSHMVNTEYLKIPSTDSYYYYLIPQHTHTHTEIPRTRGGEKGTPTVLPIQLMLGSNKKSYYEAR